VWQRKKRKEGQGTPGVTIVEKEGVTSGGSRKEGGVRVAIARVSRVNHAENK
jgi:hypothetical protein